MPDALTVASLYRLLPSLDKLLQSPSMEGTLSRYGREASVRSARAALAQIRAEISVGTADEISVRNRIAELPNTIAAEMGTSTRRSLQRVINATGVILHTNLGRAPLSRSALDYVCEVARDYSNLEFDLHSGRRSRRDVHAESLVLRVLAAKTGVQPDSHRVLVVNNCAAATFLVLNSLADGGEVIVSRGELVEIGGGFRIPEILRKSGAILREVGTTNRTRLSDYQSALSERTALILRVHQSNFRMEGFAERPQLGALMSLARRSNVPIFEDQGTGLMVHLATDSTAEDSSLYRSFKRDVDVIAASGDKLLGGPQCGIIVGKPQLIDKIAKNPLMRAFRVCKLTYAALEGTLMDYLTENLQAIPVTRMLAVRAKEIRDRCEQLAGSLGCEDLNVDVIPSKALIGGGTTPGKKLNSFALALRHAFLQPDELAARLRESKPPVVSRIRKDSVLLDLRTVSPESDRELAQILRSLDSEARSITKS